MSDRINYQRSIEEVYWRHRIWKRPDPKPPLDDVLSTTQLRKIVGDYLRNSKALETYWQQRLTAEQLQAEMERMTQHTGDPGVLRELFGALDNDPFVIAECLARPALAERLLASAYAYDRRFHGELRQRAAADLRAYRTVEQVRQLGGKYAEIEFVRYDDACDKGNRGAEASIRLSDREWKEYVKKLATMFGSAGNGVSTNALIGQFKTGVFGPLQEDTDRYYATAVTDEGQDRLKLAVIEWRKEPLESWIARTENQMPTGIAMATLDYTLPTIPDGGNGCPDNWTATTTLNAPSKRYLHTAVWTGTEMIVWSGSNDSALLNTGGRYNPSTDTWATTSITNAPVGRRGHEAIWTGSEMIVWGGGTWNDFFNTGGRYNPMTDSWIATTTTNAPSARLGHTMVWTGSKMIVWGGYESIGLANTGGEYDPNTDQWKATTTFNAPSPRISHSAVWSGNEMIIWGGQGDDQENCYTGGKYDPNLDQWTPTQINSAPEGRHATRHSGSVMK